MKKFAGLVKKLARQYFAEGLCIEDLEQEAWLTLLEHQPKYTSELGISERTFLGRKIRNRLEAFRRESLGLVEIERDWVAESIAGGPDEAIKAKSKAECEALVKFRGAEKYKKPSRVIQYTPAAVSLDAEWGDVSSDTNENQTGHDLVGRQPNQEFDMMRAELSQTLAEKEQRAKKSRKNSGKDWQRIGELRAQGYTFAQIAQELGKPTNSVIKTWHRAQKRLEKAA